MIHLPSCTARQPMAVVFQLLIALIATFGSSAALDARQCRVALVPNGGKYNCMTCHVTSNGGNRNLFGADVQKIVRTSTCVTQFWGPDLAGGDSDGDGRTNGEELGDPAGEWKPGDPSPRDINLTTQPGVKDLPPAIVSSIEPAAVARDGTTAVTIHGTNFRATTTMRIGKHALLSPQLVSSEVITGLAPDLGVSEPGGAKDVTATDASTKSTLRGAVEYPDLPPLIVTSVEPHQVADDGTTMITVVGENFLADTKVKFGTRALVNPQPPSADGRMITGVAPALGSSEALGTRDVNVSDGRGTVKLVAGVTYVEAAPPGVLLIRGDYTADGRVNLADPIAILNRLFLAAPASTCELAGDSNGDGALNLSDAVYALDFLFAGRSVPPPPFPDCGTAEPGSLGCESFSGCP